MTDYSNYLRGKSRRELFDRIMAIEAIKETLERLRAGDEWAWEDFKEQFEALPDDLKEIWYDVWAEKLATRQ